MNPVRNTGSLFCAVLLMFVSIAPFTFISTGNKAFGNEETPGIFFMSENLSTAFILEKKGSVSGSSVRIVEVISYGFCPSGRNPDEPPRMKLIRKIFVQDPSCYSSCKSVILYPFHEFS
jgi:hypothetical protein